MEQYKSLGQNFVINYEQEGLRMKGKVFSTINWTREKEKGWSYLSGSEGGVTYDELVEDCRCLFEFAITWRGIWDNRIYFKDDEYFSEELEEMSKYWKEIQELLEGIIKSSHEALPYIESMRENDK